MTKYAFRFLLAWGMILMGILALAGPAQGEEGVRFFPTQVDMAFPDHITFEARAVSSGPEIAKVQFVYGVDRAFGPDSMTRKTVEIEPGQDVALHYTWDTRDTTVVPWSPILYYWQVTDVAGRIYESPHQRVRYRDTRFSWQRRENDRVIILWHDKPALFGEQVESIALRAIQRQQQLFGVDLDVPIRIIVYNNTEEFSAWHNLALDWVGGEAFPDLAITTQIVTSRLPDAHWLNNVIPHEISHLYTYQAAYNPTAPLPVWLNEGIAQYNEFSQSDSTARVKEVARQGRLIPLTSLAEGFGQHDESRIYLAYAESLSAVQYLVETYGEEGLARLLAAYKSGLPTKEAFVTALGVDIGTFQQDWAVWLGAPRESMVTPTPWPMPTFPPTPTPMVFGAHATPTRILSSPTPTFTPKPSATPAPTMTPTPTKASPPPRPCFGLLWLLPVPLLVVFFRRGWIRDD